MPFRAMIVAALAVAIAAPASLSGASTAAATDVRSVLLRQVQLLKQQRWRAMYATYTPRFRRSCPYSRFVAIQRLNRRVVGPRFAVRRIQVRLETRTRALAAYRIVRDGRTIAAVTFRHRDVYARVRGRWLDDVDRVSAC